MSIRARRAEILRPARLLAVGWSRELDDFERNPSVFLSTGDGEDVVSRRLEFEVLQADDKVV